MMAGRTRGEEEQTLLELAQRVLPAGSFGNLAGDIMIREGAAAALGHQRQGVCRLLLGSGPMFIGHGHPHVMEAACRRKSRTRHTFFANNEHGIRLAAEIVDAVPCAEKCASSPAAPRPMPSRCVSPARFAAATRS